MQSYKSDSLLTACLISGCSLFTNVSVSPLSSIVRSNMTCSCVVYYSARCSDQGISSGVNNYYSSSGNSACRSQRMANINGALGSSSNVQYTNVPSLNVGGKVLPINSSIVYGVAFSNYSRESFIFENEIVYHVCRIELGAQYCGGISQSGISTAVNAQATG